MFDFTKQSANSHVNQQPIIDNFNFDKNANANNQFFNAGNQAQEFNNYPMMNNNGIHKYLFI